MAKTITLNDLIVRYNNLLSQGRYLQAKLEKTKNPCRSDNLRLKFLIDKLKLLKKRIFIFLKHDIITVYYLYDGKPYMGTCVDLTDQEIHRIYQEISRINNVQIDIQEIKRESSNLLIPRIT